MTNKTVPAAELDVLACLKRMDHATAREIREALRQYRPMAHGSVVNLLKRLESKALVTKKKGPVGKAFVYTTTRAASSIYDNVLHRMLNRVFGGDSLALVASLFETKPPGSEELKKLEQLLGDLKSRHSRSR